MKGPERMYIMRKGNFANFIALFPLRCSVILFIDSTYIHACSSLLLISTKEGNGIIICLTNTIPYMSLIMMMIIRIYLLIISSTMSLVIRMPTYVILFFHIGIGLIYNMLQLDNISSKIKLIRWLWLCIRKACNSTVYATFCPICFVLF